MLRFDVITLMPELYAEPLSLGVTRRAYESGQVQLRLWPLREHAEGAYRRVDDRPFGGGPGMVLMAPPLERCLQAVRKERPADGAPLIHFTPSGRPLNQSLVRELSQGPGAVLLCGRYEGIDQRFLDRHERLDISLGDFVLSGGDLPALCLLDAVARLQPGVLHDPASHEQDSFEGDGLLDCPHYSRPEVWPEGEEGGSVPAVLMSGHHADIAQWRREQSLALTARLRPDLIEAARRRGALSARDEQYLAAL